VDDVAVAFVPHRSTWWLRSAVLRPGRDPAQCRYPGEDDRRAASAAALDGDVALSVGTVLPEAPPWDPPAPGWRIRGMATAPEVRGRGLGGRVLELLVSHVAGTGGGVLWCNARTPALSLYRRAGFVARGEVFDLPEIGPHQVMWRLVTPAAPAPAPSP